jgi:cytoskeletal protein RodZ
MSRGSRLIIDLSRLLLLIILLPLILLVAGPLLVGAALVGRISLGALQLRPGKYYRGGRILAFSLGVIIWGLSWGSAAWIWQQPIPIVSSVSMTPLAIQAVSPTATNTSPPVTSPISPTATATTSPSTATSIPSPSPTRVPPSPTLTIATPTATRVVPSPTTMPTIAPSPSISLQQNDLAQTLIEANKSLIQYLQAPNSENQTLLEAFWADDALLEVQAFAQKINVKYQRPLTITYTLIDEPIITPIDNTAVTVRSREFWEYEDLNGTKESLSDYEYTLQVKNGGWVITRYQFKVLSLPTTTLPITTTEVITSVETGN